MDCQLVDILVDPLDGNRLTLEADPSGNGEVRAGQLRAAAGRCYPIVDGIPRFCYREDDGQNQTERSFGFKWHQRDTFDSAASLDNMRNWLVEKYGFDGPDRMRGYFAGRRTILDAGCGAGFSSSTWLDGRWPTQGSPRWIGVDISDAIDVAHTRLGRYPGTHFVQADVLKMPFRPGSFDTIFSEGVLHHTPSTEQAIKAAARLLEPGGEFLFYVYRKKGPVREFTDDYIREQIAGMNPADAWEALLPLTRLGRALAELNVDVDVPEDVPLLGIKKGQHDVQRLIYWNVAKLFWNDALTFEENHHINFDWYHPRYAHRQTKEQVEQWCREADLRIHHFHEQDSGFSVRATK